MGAVYEAEQDNPRRTVALKVVRSGLASGELEPTVKSPCQYAARLMRLPWLVSDSLFHTPLRESWSGNSFIW